MILFFKNNNSNYFAVQVDKSNKTIIRKLCWLFGDAEYLEESSLQGYFIGPRKEMITPWSTNAVEITQNMGIENIQRIEEFSEVDTKDAEYDPMLQAFYNGLSQDVFFIDKKPQPIIYIDNLKEYNLKEGLALSGEEIEYLEQLSHKLNRKLTDSEIFGFSQVNSEHCRHKIFNGTFIINGKEMKNSLFALIKKTAKVNPNKIVSAYKDNCAFVVGPDVEQFAPDTHDKADYFKVKDINTVISLKAETHNFPTTVEPFNGAATGTGGEIRDRMAGGKASIPMAGTAVYMTSYPRLEADRAWEEKNEPRKWLYQSPADILIKASNGASDFGNKFGQPIICGSLLTFEHFEDDKKYAYDKVIMLAGGIGFAKNKDSLKDIPEPGDVIVVLGGDNYRIGMGGGAVSSVATGEYNNAIELNAVQRSNPEMQKRVSNVVRALAESDNNPVVSIHDHGAGGHLNCLSELVEETGGTIDINKLPVGDPTLSAKEIIGNESQERMGLVVNEKDLDLIKRIAERERSPFYNVGNTTDDMNFKFEDKIGGLNPIDLKLNEFFGKPPKTIIKDEEVEVKYKEVEYKKENLHEYLEKVLQLEAVACKDWLTNKVDRSVTGKIARQQCAGKIQLPLNDLGVVALDYKGKKGIATSLGHSPVSGLINSESGSVLSVAEAMTNIIWAPLKDDIKGVSLSANWMWPCKNKGEDARLYKAVEALSDFVCKIGANVPTGKDSLSMTQKYPDEEKVLAPGTVIVSAAAEVTDINKVISPVLINNENYPLFYVDFSKDDYNLGGSSLSQIINKIGGKTPDVKDADYFVKAFNAIQNLIKDSKIVAGHDISAGGIITCLLEMCFATEKTGLNIDFSELSEKDIIKILFNENPGIVFQVNDKDAVEKYLINNNINYHIIGKINNEHNVIIKKDGEKYNFDVESLRDIWFKTSYLLDRKQTSAGSALKRYENYKKQILDFDFKDFTGKASDYGININRREPTGVKAAIIREKGVNGDREMAYSLYLAGFDVKDVHMTDLISGRENLEDVNIIVFVGGFSNSDVLGSAKGWAGAFLYNEKAKKALKNFYDRKDTLSLGICNGCQLMVELNLINSNHDEKPKMMLNDSGKFESAFINIDIQENNSVMLKSMKGMRLGVWVAHGEGKFIFPYAEDKYNIPVKYSYQEYPGNPNGSMFTSAAICSDDGRHLAMMPHLERSVLPWQWAFYPDNRKTDININDETTPWIQAFVNAREWIKNEVK